ncbi:MAG: BamA/TamA family outer membrane protein [Chitinophagales bacterium]
MQYTNSLKYSIYLCCILFLVSCNATKRILKDDQSLLISNNISVKYTGKAVEDKAALNSALGKQVVYNQQPNKKFLSLFRLKLGIYTMSVLKNEKRLKKRIALEDKVNNLTATEKEKAAYKKLTNAKKFDNILNETSGGEPPVLFDSTTLSTSIKRMKNYLFYHGYFYNDVQATFVTKKKKTKVSYKILTGQLYTYNSIKLVAEDSLISKIVNIKPKERLIKKGDVFDMEIATKERQRLAELVQNEGFFTFSPEYIFLNVDSTIGNHKVDATLFIKNEPDSSLHKKYSYEQIDIQVLDFSKRAQNLELKKNDFITDTICDVNYKVLRTSVLPRALKRSIYIKPYDIFNKDQLDKTRSSLNGLGVFKFVNIEHEPISLSPTENGLLTTIKCAPTKRHSVSSDIEVNTNASSTVGFALSGSYLNRNLFRSAAKFQFNFSAGVEFQVLKAKRLENSPINTISINSEAKINLARFFPTFQKDKCKTYQKYKPRTYLSVAYNFQRRIGLYSIHTIGVNYGYEWYNDKMRHIFSPLSFTFVNPTKITDSFQTRLNNDSRLAQSFKQQFILGQDYTFHYNNQNLSVGNYKNYFQFRANIFTSGNIIYGITKLIQKDKEKPYLLAKIPFSQFTRFEIEPRYIFNFKKGQVLAFRFFGGIGIPYGNSRYNVEQTKYQGRDTSYIREVAVMPYIKQFFSGGPNSLRGWGFRKVGPGGYNVYQLNNTNLDETGDIKLELNAEYRFGIYKLFKGAVFTDLGNIWMLKEDPLRPLANFDAKRFMKELAWDAGVGLRLDLNFFVVRFDVAVALYDPSFPVGDRWTFDKINNEDYKIFTSRKIDGNKVQGLYTFKLKDFIGLNFAIGYPF